MATLQDVSSLGQSIWLDDIRRDWIASDTFQQYIQMGVLGVTSNPIVFKNAITSSTQYDADIHALFKKGYSATQVYEHLVVSDVQQVCDLFLDTYHQTNQRDGYISLEVSPNVAHDAKATIEEAKRLWQMLNRPNAMIKIPGTKEGMAAIEELTADGININVTVLFSIDAYKQAAHAYVQGLKRALAHGKNIHSIASVASFFISRVDTLVDAQIDAIASQLPQEKRDDFLNRKGVLGIANAKCAYQWYLDFHKTPEWKQLEKLGGKSQRLLWASLGVKNPSYRDVKYMEELMGAFTVGTVPLGTLLAFLDHGEVDSRLTKNIALAKQQIKQVEQMGLSLTQATETLLNEALQLFQTAFDGLLQAIEQKKPLI